MSNEEIKILNIIIDEFINSNQIYPDDLVLFKKLSEHILSTKIDINFKSKYLNKVGLNTSYKYAYDFLNSFNSEYSKYLKNIWNNQTFEFIFDQNRKYVLPQTYKFNEKVYIDLPVNKNISDTYSIVHELIHHMNMKGDQENTFNFNIFCESVSILSEFLLSDYLLLKGFSKKEINKTKSELLAGIHEAASVINFEYYLIEKYLKTQKITEYDIIKYYDKFNEYSICNYDLDQIISNKSLNIFFRGRYVLGIFLATYMHDRILLNKKNIQEFIDFNDKLNEFDFFDIFNYFDLEIIDSIYLDLDDDSYKKLFKSYNNELKRF